MDDQQHALSALIRTQPIAMTLATDADGADGSGTPAPAALLWAVALVAALNPVRAALGGAPRRGPSGRQRRRTRGRCSARRSCWWWRWPATLLLDALDVSDPAFRIAAGVVAVITGAIDLSRRPPSAEPALRRLAARRSCRWRCPLVIRPALVLGAVSARRGPWTRAWWPPPCSSAWPPWRPPRRRPPRTRAWRVARWGAALTGAVLTATGMLLVVDGVLAV